MRAKVVDILNQLLGADPIMVHELQAHRVLVNNTTDENIIVCTNTKFDGAYVTSALGLLNTVLLNSGALERPVIAITCKTSGQILRFE